jgi:hypothetical protein
MAPSDDSASKQEDRLAGRVPHVLRLIRHGRPETRQQGFRLAGLLVVVTLCGLTPDQSMLTQAR